MKLSPLALFWPFVAVSAVVTLVACAALEHDAQVAAPVITNACRVIRDVQSSAWVDFVCDTIEATDDLVARIPQAQVVTSSKVAKPDGSVVLTMARVRCPLAAFAGDAGNDRGTP